jgi:hypothetical protein
MLGPKGVMRRVDGKQRPPPKERYNNTRISKREGAGPNMCVSLSASEILRYRRTLNLHQKKQFYVQRAGHRSRKAGHVTAQKIYI